MPPRNILVVALLAAACAGTQAPPATPTGLAYRPAIDVPVTVATTATWITLAALQPQLGALACDWCASNDFDEPVRALRWSDTAAADTASNVSVYAALPVLVFGAQALGDWRDGQLRRFPVDALLVVEATTAAGAVEQIVKYIPNRERPFVHALPADAKLKTASPHDNNTSFFSGHTTFAFALVTSAAMVATERHSRWAPWMWGAGLAAAAFTGYLRIAADKHYLSDVLVGAAVGSALGVALPLLHRTGIRAAIAPTEGGAAAALSTSW